MITARAITDESGRQHMFSFDFTIGTGGFGDTKSQYNYAVNDTRYLWEHGFKKPIGAVDQRYQDTTYYTLLKVLDKIKFAHNLSTVVEYSTRKVGQDRRFQVYVDRKNGYATVAKINRKIFTYFDDSYKRKSFKDSIHKVIRL
tara:strand:+ start:299 stop:727 length:429 start_codon:yes stop_codon:yes gene_type:complete